MENRNIQTFLRAAELKSFTKAADALGYAQSTVTLQIQQLEKELGVPLFERIGKKVVLTSAGEMMMGYANEMMELEYRMRRIGASLQDISGTLRIGVLESLLTSYLVSHIAEFRKKYPSVMLEIRTAASSELLQQLRCNELDLIFVLGHLYADDDLVKDYSHVEQILFVANPSNPLMNKEKVTFYDIINQPLVLPERLSLYRKAIENAAARFDCTLKPVIQVNNTSIIVNLLLEGPWVSILPQYLVQPYVAKEKLGILSPKDFSLDTHYAQLIHHRSKWLTPPMDKFISMVRTTYFK